jgi:hypothetical protein
MIRAAIIAAAVVLGAVAPAKGAEPPIRHAHSSSLYDGSKSGLKDEMRRLVTATDPSANLATLTEVGSDARTDILKNAAPGEWGAWVPNANACCADVGIMWNKGAWSLEWKENRKLTDKKWTDGQGRKHTTYAASAKLRHTSGRTIYLSVAHLPSKVQNGNAFYDNAQARAWRSAVDGWHDQWNAFRKKHDPDVALLAADWNIDYHSSRWRDEVGDRFPSLKLGWQGSMPDKGKGTLGKRLIDATWSTRPSVKARLLKDDDSSDHRPYGDAFKWPG